ncbi:MAG: hypothetical protein ACK55R_15245 [Cyanobacteriota bacterium]
MVVYLHGEVALGGDSPGYLARAEEIVLTGRLPVLTVQPNGYSILLAPILQGQPLRTAMVVVRLQQLLDFLIVFVLAWYAQQVLRGRSLFLVFAVVASLVLQPFTGTMASSVMTEQVVMFGSFIGFWLVVRGLRGALNTTRFLCLLCGAQLIGIASILRVDIFALNLIAMLLLGVTVWLRSRSAWKPALLALTFSLMIPLTVCGLQYGSTGEFSFAKQSTAWTGLSSWVRTLRLDRNEYTDIAFNVDSTPGRGKSMEAMPPRIFASDQERRRVADLLYRWKHSGYDANVDAGFAQLAKDRISADPFSFYVVNPLYRMQHFWLNRDGGQFYSAPLHLRPPLSTAVAATILAGRLAVIFLFFVGAISTIRSARRRYRYLSGLSCFADDFALFSIGYVLLRTLELGMVGIFKYAALMEIRYISVAVPFALVVAISGVEVLSRHSRTQDQRGVVIS